MEKKKIRIAIAGLGSRGRTAYGAILLDMKDRAEVVAVADFDENRTRLAAAEHNVAPDMVFSSVEEMLSKDKLADAVLICTQDQDHVRHALMALEKGYDILLEKPVSPDLNELRAIVRKSEIHSVLPDYQEGDRQRQDRTCRHRAGHRERQILASGPLLRERQLEKEGRYKPHDPGKVLP